ncbi:non-ribosomal peptide synthetase [Kibdelosporangium aridum]|uniref:Amino acid adenylation domain-containing protein/thioester reductase domain-containing protein n=1 Tax=Kibdelosporangium aridum TaxID=2030 RepID=A0A1Y5X498_KIBAR|nr:amino acid adenylation domain-containing protein [Kibdelosporangium aridum]SMC66646.1 amino acid adenylation domain-containing protein/thioester reductase domain-containing protein [Kibdelosporangium aridum]
MPRHQQTNKSEHALTDIHSSLGPHHAFPRHSTVLDLFCEQRWRAPDRPAIRYRDTTISYADLDAAANATANQLIDNGVSKGQLIPVLVADGPEFPTSLFGVMKTGSAFVPLDPAWPIDRLNAIMAELTPPAIVASPATVETVTELRWALPTVIVDCAQSRHDPAAPIPPPVGREPGPEDLIYGFYTSGSTGTPKCALNHHRGLVNRLTTMSRRFGDGADHVTLQNSRSTFDSSMWQVLWPLVSGGQVVLPHRDGILDLEQTAMTIGRYGVTVTDFVPSVLAVFVALLELREDLREVTSCLRRVLIGGEPATPGVVHRLRALLPGIKVTNTFGPTECSIGSVFHEITDADVERIPIGRPIDNTAAIVLDDDLEPVGVNTPGEVYLGGECVGAGYLNDPERTAGVLVDNPFPEIPGAKLYRTGDLARVGEDGLLYFAGRMDEQVKLGGVRVELGDVGSALTDHPLVGSAIAVVLGEAPDSTLVGCVTPRLADNPPSPAQLREYATEKLPAEQVPQQIVVLDALPLNHNGKVDRKALSAIITAETARQTGPAEHIEPPANPMEELVSSAWCEVLGLDQVCVVTPFADYGGNSLIANRLTVAVSARLDTTVRPRDLLVEPTVRAQAERLARGVDDDSAELAYLKHDIEWRPPQTLLVTGATGFVGAHIFAELLVNSNATLICLVRCADQADGVRRLTEVLEQYQLTSACQLLPAMLKTGRVEVVPGDLGSELLGMSQWQFDAIASSVSGVVNAAGAVNFLSGYLDHRPTNVLGVQELIKLAAGGARVHTLSTLSIFPPDEPAGRRITEEQMPAPDQVAGDGYNRSKYVAECLLANARKQGIGSVAYRLGEVWPHQSMGVANPGSLAHNLLYACARTGCVFQTDAKTDVTPVDVVSQLVSGAATGDIEVPDGAVHVLWPRTLRFAEAFETLADRCGLDHVAYGQFRERVEAAAEFDRRLAGLQLLLPPPNGNGDVAPAEFDRMFTDSSRQFDTERFNNHAVSLARPAADALATLDSYLTGLADIPALVPQER